MDLNRLRISTETESRQGFGFFRVLVVALICLALGFAVGWFFPKAQNPNAIAVETWLVHKAKNVGGRAFSAGGWIEVATPRNPIIISSKISEQISKLHVEEGQEVSPGDLIVSFDDTDIALELAIAASRVEIARSNYEKLVSGYRKEEIDLAQANFDESIQEIERLKARKEESLHAVEEAVAKLDEAKENLRIAVANYERGKELQPDTVSVQDLDELRRLSVAAAAAVVAAEARLAISKAAQKTAEKNISKAEAQSEAAKANLARMKSGYRKEEIEIAKTELELLISKHALAKRKLEYCSVRVPNLGKKLRVLQIFVSPGQQIDPSKIPSLVSLYDPADLQMRIDVSQANIISAKIGGKVEIRTDASDRSYNGVITRIDPQAILSKNTITVRVAIKDPDERLFPEMVAQADFMVSENEADAEDKSFSVPLASILEDAEGKFVYLVVSGKARKSFITVEGSFGNLVKIASGVKSGDRVITTKLERISDGTPITEE